jgi:hypothetical protein
LPVDPRATPGLRPTISARPELIAVSASTNTSKGDRGPEDWKPPRRKVSCLYARWWINVKTTWRLTITRREKGALADTAQALLAEFDVRARR